MKKSKITLIFIVLFFVLFLVFPGKREEAKKKKEIETTTIVQVTQTPKPTEEPLERVVKEVKALEAKKTPEPITEAEDFCEWKITAYCPCEQCSGKYGHQTSTGKRAIEGRTVAVDPDIIPYGSEVIIDGHTYIAEDCGGCVKKYHIDIFFENHEDVEKFGKQYKRVEVIKSGS